MYVVCTGSPTELTYVASGSCSTSVRYFASAWRRRSSCWWRFVTSRSETANSSGPGTSTRVIASSAGNERRSERSAVISRRDAEQRRCRPSRTSASASRSPGRDDQLEERLADRVGARPAERLLGRGVHLDDQAFVVDDHDGSRALREGSASLRASLAASIRSERLRCVTSIIVAITPTTFPFASRIGAAEMLASISEPSRCSRRTSRSRISRRAAMRASVVEERRQLLLGDDRADAADRLVGGPPEDLGCAAVPRADAAVEAEVDDRHRRSVDQRAVVLVRVLDLLELRGLLERGRRLVRKRAEDLQPLGVRPQPVGRIVGPDVADAAAAASVQRHEQPVVLPRVRAAPVALRAVARRAVGKAARAAACGIR